MAFPPTQYRIKMKSYQHITAQALMPAGMEMMAMVMCMMEFPLCRF